MSDTSTSEETRSSETQRSRKGIWLALMALTPFVYVASFGPAYFAISLLVEKTGSQGFGVLFYLYLPLVFLMSHDGGWLMAYLEWWGSILYAQ